MTFLEELQHVSPKVDDEGYAIEWVDALSMKADILALLTRLPANQKVGLFHRIPSTSAATLLDEHYDKKVNPENTACFVRREADGSLHTARIVIRENSMAAYGDLAVGGVRDYTRNHTYHRCLYDVGIRILRRRLNGTPEMVAAVLNKMQFDRIVEETDDTYVWSDWKERP